ncbi:MAG: hypothetical protein HOE69_07095 [Euryarchaeota archaeon]|jgi:hypothetical protein|nr:hypothetical protein [Euryarchaeota archaeon]
MAGGSEVEFPGKKKQKMRMRGTKKASDSVQKRLRKNLDVLLEEPHTILPTIVGPTSPGFGRRDKLKACLKDIEKVISKREDRKWLHKRMAARKGDLVARAFAGSLAAAHEDEFETVAVFKHPVYGSSSFIRRGSARPAHLLGIQMHSNPQFRLLAWEELARSGYWFFAWGNELICTGVKPTPPTKWVEESLTSSPLKFTDDDGVWKAGSGSNVISLKYNNGMIAEISLDVLSKSKESFIQNIALTMSPPRLTELMEVETNYKPEGWPDDKEMNDASKDAMESVIQRWLRLEIPDNHLQTALHNMFSEQLDEGLMLKDTWFDNEDIDDFLKALQGSKIELEAVAIILDTLEGGVRVDAAGEAHWLAGDVIRLEEDSAHSLLRATWGKCGMDILEVMFDLTGEDADNIYEQQLNSRKAFSGFLTKLNEKQSGVRMMKMFPWASSDLPTPLNFADELIKKAHTEGVGKTTTMARKAGGSKSSIGWAWVSVHGKGGSEAWHYEPSIRDKGGDWVPSLDKLWKASKNVVENNEYGDYIAAMDELRSATGTIEKLPDATS